MSVLSVGEWHVGGRAPYGVVDDCDGDLVLVEAPE
jgi:hypothetical protein